MLQVAYLFERFPSFGQTFCYREVAELVRQGVDLSIFSIRRPADELLENWDPQIVARVHYLPDERGLVAEVDGAARCGLLPPEAARAVAAWERKSDFLRLYQGAYVGLRLRESGVRKLHAHFAGMAARTAYWVAKFFGLPFSFTAHANDIFAPRPFAVDLAALVDAAQAVVTVSDYALGRLREEFPDSAAKFRRVYNGIDPSDFRQSHFGAGPPLIVSVGRLIEKKGFGDLIEACRVLCNDRVEFQCEIIGEGPLHAALAAQVSAARLESSVILSGPQTQARIAQRLAAAQVFALACKEEPDGGADNLPTVIMEAMAAALPVVSTTIAGVPEMVEQGVSGELVARGDPAALAASLRSLLQDPERARSFGRRGLQIAREKFTIERSARQLIELFTAGA